MRALPVLFCNRTSILFAKITLFLFFLLPSSIAFSQQGVSVNQQTGTANITIPIYTLHRRDVSVPISLSYSATGVHVNDVAGGAGMGWSLNAGGQIIRQLRDLPDDQTVDITGASRKGWMYNSNGALINNFTLANDNNPATCTDEATDLAYINTNFSNYSDLEPDIFTVNAPGLSCNLVYDNVAGVFRTVPYQDLKISYTSNTNGIGIWVFTITNDKGMTYVFGQEEVTQIKAISNGGTISNTRQYACYQNGVNVTDAWFLTSMKDAGGNTVNFSYIDGDFPVQHSTPVIDITGVGASAWATNPQFTLQTNSFPELLTKIQVYNVSYGIDYVNFNYAPSFNKFYDEISSISCGNGKTFAFTYGHAGAITIRDYLKSFGEVNCDNSTLYQFAYSGVNLSAGTSTLPDSASFEQDYWGYDNGNTAAGNITPQLYVFPDNASYPNLERYRYYTVPGYTGTYFTLAGTDRSANASYVAASTLTQMTTPLGGTVSFTYEPNDYYDVSAATTHIGAGIRIKQIVFYDGVNTAGNVTKNYTYTDPSTGITTGQPISLPQFAFTLPSSGDPGTQVFWNLSTVRNALNVSGENTTILYSKVKEQQTGAGSSLYQFVNPGTFWQTSALPDWSPTVTDVGAPTTGGTCPIYSAKNSTYGYPFPPNVNYDFERGLPSSVTRYNDAGVQVGQTVYTYQRSYSTPVKIPGFIYETAGTATYYAKYFLELATSELLTTVKNYTNDIGNTTNDAMKQMVSTNNYYYQSPNHKLVTKLESVNTDGTINRQYIQYTKDYYTPAMAADSPSAAIGGLVKLNQNLPIEKYWTVVKSGTEVAVAAELYKYSSVTPSIPTHLYLPSNKYTFLSGAGVTNFAFSTISNAGTFQNYSGYNVAANYTAYHPNGVLSSSNDNYKNTKTDLIEDDLLLPVATFSNAAANEVGYSGFETTGHEYNWTVTSGVASTSTPRSGLYCQGLSTSTLITQGFSLHSGAAHYVFSFWINSATSGALTVKLLNSGGSQFSSTAVNFVATGTNQWQFYEVKIPTTGITSTFSISIQSSVAGNIDDLLFYPELTEVSTAVHNINTGLITSATNTNGVAQYYAYDNLNRLQFVYDQDKNITLKRTYVNPNAELTYASANFTYLPTSISGNAAVTFTGPSNTTCAPGTYYAWNFGDGKTTSPTVNAYQTVHSYAAAGTYTVTLNTTNSIFGNKQTSQTVTVAAGPELAVSVCQSGVNNFNKSANTFTTTTCLGHPTDNVTSYFWLTIISNAPPSPSYSYQWQIIYNDGGSGNTSFTAIPGATSSNYSTPFNISTARPFNIRLVITDVNSGQSATSNILTFGPAGV